ncbi:hypothetical protein [Crossiella sp. CA198]|uniref:hypothetical protein n=1 Tax=Crossiella sp. CA198 TaxID=3455607 RepID=UPI003F8D8805
MTKYRVTVKQLDVYEVVVEADSVYEAEEAAKAEVIEDGNSYFRFTEERYADYSQGLSKCQDSSFR